VVKAFAWCVFRPLERLCEKKAIRPRIVRHNNMYNILTVHVFSSPQQLINATKCDEFTFVQFTPFEKKNAAMNVALVFIVATSECALHARVRTSSSPTDDFFDF
jgi:hypothetical protein